MYVKFIADPYLSVAFLHALADALELELIELFQVCILKFLVCLEDIEAAPSGDDMAFLRVLPERVPTTGIVVAGE